MHIAFDTGKLCGVWTPRGYNQTTASGKPFWVADPRPQDIRIQDIAAHLSRLCRFGGALRDDIDHYSVAQHCVLVSWHVPTGFELEGLLHDAAEAYVGDLIKPVKMQVAGFEAVEDRVDAAIRKRFGLPATMSDEVKEADYRAVVTEHRDVHAPNDGVDWGPLAAPWRTTITPLSARVARGAFLDRFNELTGGCYDEV